MVTPIAVRPQRYDPCVDSACSRGEEQSLVGRLERSPCDDRGRAPMATRETGERGAARASTRLSRRTFVSRLGLGAVTVFASSIGQVATPSPTPTRPTPRLRHRIGAVMGRGLPPCEAEPSDWQATSWGQLRGAPSQPLPASCPQSVFWKILEGRGYRIGHNLELMVASPPDGVQDFTKPAAEIVARNVDLIIAVGSNAAHAAKNATTTIPIVVSNLGDVVETGLVPELARPGGNITGVARRTLDLALKRIELFREAFPGATRPLLVHGAQVSHTRAAGPAVELARQLGLSPIAIEVQTDPSAAVARAKKAIADGADSIVVIAGSPQPVMLLAIVKEHRLPAVFSAEAYMDAGGALNMVTVIDYVAKADYVDRILRGAKPGDLPIVIETEFQLVVDLKAAEALGTPIAASVVARATKVPG
jgi:putative ABC transport system substrate-binding protein